MLPLGRAGFRILLHDAQRLVNVVELFEILPANDVLEYGCKDNSSEGVYFVFFLEHILFRAIGVVANECVPNSVGDSRVWFDSQCGWKPLHIKLNV